MPETIATYRQLAVLAEVLAIVQSDLDVMRRAAEDCDLDDAALGGLFVGLEEVRQGASRVVDEATGMLTEVRNAAIEGRAEPVVQERASLAEWLTRKGEWWTDQRWTVD